MKQTKFKSLNIHYNNEMHFFMNNEIHAILNENQEFKIHPRWNVNFFISRNEITVDLNDSEEEQ
ncbi:hypothetical protein MHB50_09265 [Siminovitchia sp. FSL H7-0308]|uniref:hypothetical protein n=1 Tax=Siminovitchia sp. FSL H7-0308 TaxID=2921432 RepID=UPI0030EC66F0